MSPLPAVLLKALLSFAAVNLDEFAVLVVFFSRVDHVTFTNAHVIVGQLVGFTIIFAFSLIGSLFRSWIDLQYIALLGAVPLVMGIVDLVKAIRYWYTCPKSKTAQKNIVIDNIVQVGNKSRNKSKSNTNTNITATASSYQASDNYAGDNNGNADDDDDDDGFADSIEDDQSCLLEDGFADSVYQPSPKSAHAHPHARSLSMSSFSVSSSDSSHGEQELLTTTSPLVASVRKVLSHVLELNTLLVCLTIIADGSEEVAVFLPLLAVVNTFEVVLILVVFYCLVCFQCFLAYQLVHYTFLAKSISRNSKNIVPLLLIGLGVYILSNSALMKILTK